MVGGIKGGIFSPSPHKLGLSTSVENMAAQKELAGIDLEGLDLTGEEFNFDDVDGET
jgi:hypothetical protein